MFQQEGASPVPDHGPLPQEAVGAKAAKPEHEEASKQQGPEQRPIISAGQLAPTPQVPAVGDGFSVWLRGERAKGDTFGYCLALVRALPEFGLNFNACRGGYTA